MIRWRYELVTEKAYKYFVDFDLANDHLFFNTR